MLAIDRPLITERLVLRPLAESDVGALFAIHSDPKSMRYWSAPIWQDDERSRKMVAQDLDPALTDHVRLGIEIAATGRLIGTCAFFAINPQCRRAEMGYMMASDAWGHGYMREALAAFIAHGFTALDLNRIEADTDPRNERSMQLLERLGFTHEGHFRERWVVDGEVSDSAMYGLLRRNWRREMKGEANGLSLDLSDVADEAVRRAIVAPLVRYNESRAGPGHGRPLVIGIRDASGAIVGGLWGATGFGWLFTQLLVVPESARGQGLGRRLMTMAESEAIARGCHGAWLDTFEFQARGFYERLGYVGFGTLPEYPRGSSRFFMCKALAAS